MAKTLRVHHLAKELGVASKEIIAKCNAEGLEPPLKNHMAVVSIGLAESIREWFSVGVDVTTIEVASPVDLTKVKRPRKRKTRRSQAAVGVAEGDGVATETLEPTAAPLPSQTEVAVLAEGVEGSAAAAPAAEAAPEVTAPAVDEHVPTVAEKAAVATLPSEEAESEREPEIAEWQVAGEAETAVLKPPEAPAETETPEPAQEPEVPEKPVTPAGPQLVPKPAELRGPRVVRIEAPEPVRTPRLRPGSRPAAYQPTTFDAVELIPERGAPPRGRAGRGRRGVGEGPLGRARSPRRRTSGADVSERLKEWRDQDLLERKERLASATGHGVRARRSAERIRRVAGPTVQPTRRTEVEVTLPITVEDLTRIWSVFPNEP
ncbi:MAG: translation initiation factor IF-2 N-terminal domain-containing protein, partial [Phycisphaerae bacterium]